MSKAKKKTTQTPEEIQMERTKVAIAVINAAESVYFNMIGHRLHNTIKSDIYDMIHDDMPEITKEYIQHEVNFMESYIGTPFIPYNK